MATVGVFAHHHIDKRRAHDIILSVVLLYCIIAAKVYHGYCLSIQKSKFDIPFEVNRILQCSNLIGQIYTGEVEKLISYSKKNMSTHTIDIVA